MKKRFMLTAAGLSAAALAGAADAALVKFDFTYDLWASEASWQISTSSGVMIASMWVSGGYVFTSGVVSSSFGANGSSTSNSGYFHSVVMEMNASSTYHVTLHDSFGDGWAWGSVDGTNALVYNGVSYSAAASALNSLNSVTYDIHVLPAPGALALLGLAGLARRRRH